MIEINLPGIICLNDFGGDFDVYLDKLYVVFTADFIHSKPSFRGQRLRLKYHPEVDGKAYTFYHMTHAGIDEGERIPEMRRCERIPWAKPVIQNCDKWSLKIWPQRRNGKNRICIWLEKIDEPDYFVVLEIRKDYILPWTAFVAEYNNQKRKKMKEYKAYMQGVEKQEPPSDT